jgi:hypothetical protein
MANKFHDMGIQNGEQWVVFHCPGCEGGHGIPVTGNRAWAWNGSLEKPTIQPSILVNVAGRNPTQPVCHSLVKDGNITFLSDVTSHTLAGQTVEIPDWD